LRKKRTQRKNDKDRKLEEAKKKYIMKVRKETLDYDKPKKKKVIQKSESSNLELFPILFKFSTVEKRFLKYQAQTSLPFGYGSV
jgi:hypothetical protein